MKHKSLLLLLLPVTAQSADIGVSWSVSELNQPVHLETGNKQISALNQNLQLNYSLQDWLFGIAMSKADNSKQWFEENADVGAELAYDSHEIYANYYLDNWTFSAAIGQSDINYQFDLTGKGKPARLPIIQRRDKQAYENKDKFYELSARYFYDLSAVLTDLSVDFELNTTHFDTRSKQRIQSDIVQLIKGPRADEFLLENQIHPGPQMSDQFDINESVWIVSLATSFDYSFTLLEKDWLASIWYEKEVAGNNDGLLTISRLRNNNRVVRQDFPLSETSEQNSVENLTTYGVDVNLAVSDSLSAFVSLLDSDVSEVQWQAGISYWF